MSETAPSLYTPPEDERPEEVRRFAIATGVFIDDNNTQIPYSEITPEGFKKLFPDSDSNSTSDPNRPHVPGVGRVDGHLVVSTEIPNAHKNGVGGSPRIDAMSEYIAREAGIAERFEVPDHIPESEQRTFVVDDSLNKKINQLLDPSLRKGYINFLREKSLRN